MMALLLRKSRGLGRSARGQDVPPLRDRGIVLAAFVLTVLRQRELNGKTTCLRDLHILLEIKQPEALRVVHLLEREGMVRIGEEFVDRFAAPVSLCLALREDFDRLVGPDIVA